MGARKELADPGLKPGRPPEDPVEAARGLAFPQSLLIPAAALGVLAGFWLRLPEARWDRGLAALGAGLAAWTLLEYALHRLVLHHIEPFRAWHLQHHRAPEMPLRIPVPFSLALVLAVVGGPVLAGVGGAGGVAFSGGLLVGLLAQDIVHYKLHQGLCRPGGLLLTRQREHAFHHAEDDRRAFGTLTGFWDRLFGTAPPPP